MKKTILLAAAMAAAMTLSACGGSDGGSAYAGNYYAETTTTAGKRTVSDKTVTLGNWVGTYSGELDDEGYLDGQGKWVSDYMSDFPDQSIIVNGLWSNGAIYNGTIECYYKNAYMGKAAVIKGEINEEDFAAIDNNIANAISQEEWNDTVEGIKEIGGYIGDFINWYDSVS